MTNQVTKQQPAYLVLTVICLVAALVLAGTNAITSGPIREHEMAAQREAFGAVMAAEEYIQLPIPENSEITSLVEAKSAGKTVGYCVVASGRGYAGPVAVTLGIGTDGVITGAKIGDNSFVETAGFGARWLADNKAEEFVGINTAEGGAIEALSGATVTSNAVLAAANQAIAAVNTLLGREDAPALVFGAAEKAPVEQPVLTGAIHEGNARGFQSDVRVQLTLDANGAVSGLAIDSANETANFGTRCMEDAAFISQFVGKTAPFTVGENIDALAGATVTSKAVTEAVNAAVAAPANPDAVPFGAENGAEDVPEAPAEPEDAVEVFAPAENVVEGTAKGFQSDIKVTVTLDDSGKIAALTIDSSKETPHFGTRCAEDEAFIKQFIGQTAPVQVDALTGATVTSNAVVEAINAVMPKPAANVVEGTAKGFQSDIKVTVTLDDNNAIAALTIDSSKETPNFGTRCAEDEAFIKQFIGQTAPVKVDALTGATVTSNAVVEAINAALNK